MKKYFILLCLLFCSSAYATDFFFQKSIGYWTVFGHPGSFDEKKLNPACILATDWDDGSYVNLIQDLKDGELLLELKNNAWNIGDVDLTKIYEMTLNFYGNDGKVQSWPTRFKFLSKNTVQIRNLDIKNFISDFKEFDKMVFIMPGTITNVTVGLNNSKDAIGIMIQCLDVSKGNRKPSESIQQGI